MCGRYTLTTSLDDLVEEFHVTSVVLEEYRPRYNVAPGQLAPVVVRGREGLRLGELRWGLIPHWAENPSTRDKHVNARAETAATHPVFREAFQRRRCLIPADGFYEWSQDGPHWIHRTDLGLVAFAGLWDRWRPTPESEPQRTFCILTTAASDWLRQIHHRMPVLLPPEGRDLWLDARSSERALRALLRPSADDLVSWPVSKVVNSVAFDDPTCIVALDGPSH
jgi:putative SOS response-associated peptidase YedK